jgi:hypothetical protein
VQLSGIAGISVELPIFFSIFLVVTFSQLVQLSGIAGISVELPLSFSIFLVVTFSQQASLWSFRFFPLFFS